MTGNHVNVIEHLIKSYPISETVLPIVKMKGNEKIIHLLADYFSDLA
jgi:hypothetical protein